MGWGSWLSVPTSPKDFVSLFVTLYFLFVLFVNVSYPLRKLMQDPCLLSSGWGGDKCTQPSSKQPVIKTFQTILFLLFLLYFLLFYVLVYLFVWLVLLFVFLFICLFVWWGRNQKFFPFSSSRPVNKIPLSAKWNCHINYNLILEFLPKQGNIKGTQRVKIHRGLLIFNDFFI